MKALLLQLLERLEKVGDDHEEVFDTDVREEMREAVTEGFLRPVPGFAVPDNYAMFSPQGDTQVKQVLAWFIPLANERARVLGLNSFHKRLDAFQDDDVETERQSTYDEFFGWAKPGECDDEGKPLERQ